MESFRVLVSPRYPSVLISSWNSTSKERMAVIVSTGTLSTMRMTSTS